VKETCNDNVRQTIYEQAVTGKNALYSIFYAKHNCPEYRERVQVDVTMIHSEIENRLEQLQAKFTGVAEMVMPQEVPQEVPPQLPPQSTKEIIAEVFGLSPERVPEPRD
jgi:nitric oxide reductase activation protein